MVGACPSLPSRCLLHREGVAEVAPGRSRARLLQVDVGLHVFVAHRLTVLHLPAYIHRLHSVLGGHDLDEQEAGAPRLLQSVLKGALLAPSGRRRLPGGRRGERGSEAEPDNRKSETPPPSVSLIFRSNSQMTASSVVITSRITGRLEPAAAASCADSGKTSNERQSLRASIRSEYSAEGRSRARGNRGRSQLAPGRSSAERGASSAW